jgi:hypothetical protein
VCITTTVEPKSIKTSEFALAWHMPEVKFGLGQKLYSKFVIAFISLFNLLSFYSSDGIQNGLINPH